MSNTSTPRQLVEKLLETGLKQPAIARLAQTSQATISRILTGDTKSPSFAVVDRLREAVERAEAVKPKRKRKAA